MRSILVAMSVVWLLAAAGGAAAQDGAATGQDIRGQIKNQVDEIGQKLDQSDAAREASAGILRPIYDAAEYISAWPWFYWAAFALMVAGVVSFVGQLVFSKFLLLFKLHLSLKEILGDVLGLLVSAVGLVLTTQAATQNSGFTQSPAAVLSATVVGALTGFVFYLWGQSQEFRAAKATKTRKEQPSRANQAG